MRKSALSDDILLRIEKPARYIGGEFNSVMKDLSDISIRFAMCFPDVYEIGMSHLGIAILYDMFNRRQDTWCERVYCPWVDLETIMREESIPLFALESQDPVKDFDFLGITLQYEMCYTNVLQVLDLADIPLHAADRTEDDPIVIGGGPCTYNPEPLAPFFDMFYIGEGEVTYDQLLDIYRECKQNRVSRAEFLRKAASVPGIYVPSLYKADYNDDGTLHSFVPLEDGIPEKIIRQVVTDPSDICYPKRPVIPFVKAVQDRVVLEVMRGCIRGCRFCQAGMTYRPSRSRSVDELVDIAVSSLEATGYDELSLSSLSTSDYKDLEQLIDRLLPYLHEHNIELELPSLRIDAVSLEIMKRISGIKRGSFTFAPEAGTQRLRDVINKGLSIEEITTGARLAFEGGWKRVKLYFMLGLPTETDEDAEGIAALSNDIAHLYYEIPKEERIGRCQITASSSFFVPKPFTPFQWSAMLDPEEYHRCTMIVKDAVRRQTHAKSLRYQYHGSKMSYMEAVLARGDRRLADFIEALHEKGARYDAWTEFFDADRWYQTFDELGIDHAFYAMRERDLDELFPWDFIETGLSKEYLKNEYRRAVDGKTTPHCRQQCTGCGMKQLYHGGVCVED